MLLVKPLLERLMSWSRSFYQVYFLRAVKPSSISRYKSQDLFLHTFNIWNYKHLRLRETFLKTVEMDCAVKRYEAYFCSSVPRKPENETYGVQQDGISFLQACFFWTIHCTSLWLLPSSLLYSYAATAWLSQCGAEKELIVESLSRHSIF